MHMRPLIQGVRAGTDKPTPERERAISPNDLPSGMLCGSAIRRHWWRKIWASSLIRLVFFRGA